MLGVKDQIFNFPKCSPISKQNLVMFGSTSNVLHKKSIGGNYQESPNEESVRSTDSHLFASSFSFPQIKISKTYTKRRIWSGFFYRKYNVFRETDHQPYTFGFSRRCSADLQIKVTQFPKPAFVKLALGCLCSVKCALSWA